MLKRFSFRFVEAIVLLVPAIHGILWAQAPQVTAVVNQITGDRNLSPGGRAQVNFTPIGATTIAISVGGLPARGIGTTLGSGSVVVLLPRELASGVTSLVLTDGVHVSAPFEITLDSTSPALVPPQNRICPTARADITLSAIGLGPTSPLLPTSNEGNSIPPSTINMPRLTIGGAESDVTSSVLVPQTYGIYQVTANLPPHLPGGLQSAVLTIDGKTSNRVNLLVGLTVELAAAGAAIGKGAPEAIMTAKGCSGSLGPETAASTGRNLPTVLAGVSVKVKDSSGVERQALLYSVSPDHIDYVMPKETQTGPAIVTVQSSTGALSNSTLDVQAVEPGILGYFLVRVRDGLQSIEAVPSSLAIDLGPEADQVYLVVLATGLRARSSLSNVHVTIIARDSYWGPNIGPMVDAPVEYAGPQAEFAGLDQVNVRLPRSITGFGQDSENGATITLEVDKHSVALAGFSFR